MTDVTGFGLLGHLSEICQGSGVQATLHFSSIPRLPAVAEYIAAGCVPGGTGRNFDSYGHLIGKMSDLQKSLLCDPQTSGGLLLAVLPDAEAQVQEIAAQHGMTLSAIGELNVVDNDRALIEITE